MQRQVATKKTPPIPGVISTIADGFSMALWRPFVIIIPLVLDLYYWLGWKIELGAFAVSLQHWLTDLGVNRADANMIRIARISQWDVSTAPSFFFIPSLLSGANPAQIYEVRSRDTFTTLHWGVDLAILLGVFVASMLLSAAFLAFLGEKALDLRWGFRERASETVRILVRLTGVTLLAIGVVGLISGAILAWRIHTSQDIGPVFTVALLVQFFISLGLWFAPDAIVMARAGTFGAIRLSLRTFRDHFWSSLGFVAASVTLGQGMHDLFLRVASSAPGLLAGIVLYALFSSGLALASFWFFNNRNQLDRSLTSKSASNPLRSFRSKEK